MRMHRVLVPDNKPIYAASNEEAVGIRQEIVKETGRRRATIVIEPVDVPTTKPELIAFLNGLHRSA